MFHCCYFTENELFFQSTSYFTSIAVCLFVCLFFAVVFFCLFVFVFCCCFFYFVLFCFCFVLFCFFLFCFFFLCVFFQFFRRCNSALRSTLYIIYLRHSMFSLFSRNRKSVPLIIRGKTFENNVTLMTVCFILID